MPQFTAPPSGQTKNDAVAGGTVGRQVCLKQLNWVINTYNNFDKGGSHILFPASIFLVLAVNSVNLISTDFPSFHVFCVLCSRK